MFSILNFWTLKGPSKKHDLIKPIKPHLHKRLFLWHSQIDKFISYVKDQGLHYTSNNIILTMGEDFQYQFAAYNFKSLDLLIK